MSSGTLRPLGIFQRGKMEAIAYSYFIAIGQLVKQLVEHPQIVLSKGLEQANRLQKSIESRLFVQKRIRRAGHRRSRKKEADHLQVPLSRKPPLLIFSKKSLVTQGRPKGGVEIKPWTKVLRILIIP